MIRAGVKLVHGIFPAWRVIIYQMFIIVYNNTIIKRKRHSTFDTESRAGRDTPRPARGPHLRRARGACGCGGRAAGCGWDVHVGATGV